MLCSMLLSKKCSPLNHFANLEKEVSRRTSFLVETESSQYQQSKRIENFRIFFSNIFINKTISLTTFFCLGTCLKKILKIWIGPRKMVFPFPPFPF